MKIHYNPKLKEYARQLRNNSTKAEIRLWQQLKRDQIRGYDFHRQKPIDHYIADFFCNKLKLVIEVDGFTHLLDETIAKDKRKERKFNELGIHVLRFTDDEVLNDMENVIRVIEGYIDEFEARET
ncbi:MAG: endonuclease domain-containing protein [Bacteroidetes bacterium]|nr:endonuclease domain-containing protein [Bacteroidota bacterium]